MRWLTPFALGAALIATSALARSPHADRVTICRDAFGIPTIHGVSDADAVYGMTYAQAEDDFPRVERNYLIALGRLAEAEGEGALWSDVRQRLWIDEAELKALHARAPAWLRALNQAWADALNDYFVDHPSVTPRAIMRFEPWMPLAFSEGSIGGDIERVDLAALRALYQPGTARVALYDPFARVGEAQGSNGIALAPSRSRDGRALLLINPHTSFAFRSEAQVMSDAGLHVHGASTWGQYFVYQGWNRNLGWMHTSSAVDNVDEYRVRLEPDGRHYRHGSAIRPVSVRNVAFRIRRPDGTMETRRFDLRATHHGPITRAESDGALIATALMHRPLQALVQSWQRTRASGLADYLRIAEGRANSSNNTILATRAGDIAFLMPQYVPRRDPALDWTKPVDGNNPATDARGLHSLRELPSVINPRSGFVQNSNDAPWHTAGEGTLQADRYPAYMDGAGMSMRGLNALNLLGDGRKHDLDTLRDLAFSRALPAFDRLIPPLIAAFDALPSADPRRATLAEPIALLRDWDRRWGLESAGLTIAHRWGTLAVEAVPPGGRASVTFAAIDALPADRKLAMLADVADRLRREWGTVRVAWRQINCWQQPVSPFERRFSDTRPCVPVPFASGQWGSYATFVPTAAPGQRRQYGVHGNSFVATVAFGREPEARAIMVGGQSSAVGSRHANDQIQLYATGQLRPVPWRTSSASGGFVERYQPGRRDMISQR